MENDPPPPDSEIKQQIKVKIVKAPAIREISKEEVTRGLQSGAFRKGKEKDKVKIKLWLLARNLERKDDTQPDKAIYEESEFFGNRNDSEYEYGYELWNVVLD